MLSKSKQIPTDKKFHGKAVMTPRQARHVRLLIINDLYNGLFKKTEDLKGRIIRYANEYHRLNKEDAKVVKDLPKSTFYDFLNENNIPTPNQAKKIPKEQLLLSDLELSTEQESQTEHAEFEVEKLGSIKNNSTVVPSESTQATSQVQSRNEYDAPYGSNASEFDFVVEQEATLLISNGTLTGTSSLLDGDIRSQNNLANQKFGGSSQGITLNNNKTQIYEPSHFLFGNGNPLNPLKGIHEEKFIQNNIISHPCNENYFTNYFVDGGSGVLQRLQCSDQIEYEDKHEMKGQLLSQYLQSE